ncbi:MAG: hypothetical protein JNL97_13855, partial [Verrucomicrobiales bacterium]|nr:hypothetical protein [Verrucomicrobiales bacterium]
MNGDDPKTGTSAVPPEGGWEVQLTARLLGELSEAESRVLDQALARDPELLRLEARLRRTLAFVREAAAEPGEPNPGAAPLPRMSPGRRERLLERLRGGSTTDEGPAPTVIPVSFAGEPPISGRWRGAGWLAVAAGVVGLLLAASILPEIGSRTMATRSRYARADDFLVAEGRARQLQEAPVERWTRTGVRAAAESLAEGAPPQTADAGVTFEFRASDGPVGATATPSTGPAVLDDSAPAVVTSGPMGSKDGALSRSSSVRELSSSVNTPVTPNLAQPIEAAKESEDRSAPKEPPAMEPRLMARYGLGANAPSGGSQPVPPPPAAAASVALTLAGTDTEALSLELARRPVSLAAPAKPSASSPVAGRAEEADKLSAGTARRFVVQNSARPGILAGTFGAGLEGGGGGGGAGFGGGGGGVGGLGGAAPVAPPTPEAGRPTTRFFGDYFAAGAKPAEIAQYSYDVSRLSEDVSQLSVDPASGAVVPAGLADGERLSDLSKSKANTDGLARGRVAGAAAGPVARGEAGAAGSALVVAPSGSEPRFDNGRVLGRPNAEAEVLERLATVEAKSDAKPSETMGRGYAEGESSERGAVAAAGGRRGLTTWDFALPEAAAATAAPTAPGSAGGSVLALGFVTNGTASESRLGQISGKLADDSFDADGRVPALASIQADDKATKGVPALGDVPTLGKAFVANRQEVR